MTTRRVARQTETVACDSVHKRPTSWNVVLRVRTSVRERSRVSRPGRRPQAPSPAVAPAARADDPYVAMLRGALLPTAVVSVPVVLACWWWQGGPGLVGAMLGALLTVAFFGTSLVVMRRTTRLEPMMVMAVALLTYLTKIGLLGLFLVLTGNAEWLSGECFAIAVVAAALIWLPLEVRAYARARLSVYDEPHTTPGEPKSPVSVAE